MCLSSGWKSSFYSLTKASAAIGGFFIVRVTTHCQSLIGWALTRLTGWCCSQWQQPLVIRLCTLNISRQRSRTSRLWFDVRLGIDFTDRPFLFMSTAIASSFLSWCFGDLNVMLVSVFFFGILFYSTAGRERVHAQTARLARRRLPDEGWRRQVTTVTLTGLMVLLNLNTTCQPLANGYWLNI